MLKHVICRYSVCFIPPVTSHMGVIGESSDGTPPRGSGSTEALPGIRSTRANRRWSQRKGSFVSSLPGSGVVRGRWSWKMVAGSRTMSDKYDKIPICNIYYKMREKKMMILKHHHVFLTLNDSFKTICTIHWLVTEE